MEALQEHRDEQADPLRAQHPYCKSAEAHQKGERRVLRDFLNSMYVVRTHYTCRYTTCTLLQIMYTCVYDVIVK